MRSSNGTFSTLHCPAEQVPLRPIVAVTNRLLYTAWGPFDTLLYTIQARADFRSGAASFFFWRWSRAVGPSMLPSERTDSARPKMTGDEDRRVEKLKYFHYRLHRVDASPMLKRTGDFILRKMKQEGKDKFAVSVKWGEQVRHFPIQRDHNRYCFEARLFHHVRDLIEWHVDTGTPITHASGVRLERGKERQPWELLTRQIETKKKLGSGNFGTVFEAALTKSNGQTETVAVKTLDKLTGKSDDEVERGRIEMLEEARIMREVTGHPNIVAAVGVTIDTEQPVAGMELVRGNSLEKVLRPPAEPMSKEMKLKMVAEAADGLGFIHRKGYVHRDMAARNCLVKMTGNKIEQLKITDFGMARFVGEEKVYKLTQALQMPIAWSALESLEKLVWSVESDIWSLGVLMWEIFVDGAMPYNEYESWSRENAIKNLKEGKRLEIQPDVPPAIAAVMRKCWDQNPKGRPSVDEIRDAAKRAMMKK